MGAAVSIKAPSGCDTSATDGAASSNCSSYLAQEPTTEWKMFPTIKTATDCYTECYGFNPGHLKVQHAELLSIFDDEFACSEFIAFVTRNKGEILWNCWKDFTALIVGSSKNLYPRVMDFYKTYVATSSVSTPLYIMLTTVDASRRDECVAYFNTIDQTNFSRNCLDQLSWLRQACFFVLYGKYFLKFKQMGLYADLVDSLRAKYNVVAYEDFEYESMLGTGSFGLVMRCRKKTTGKYYAVKIQHKQTMVDNYAGREWRFDEEKQAYIALNHPFIVKMEYAFQSTTLAMMALELSTVGDLRSVARRLPNDCLPPGHVVFYAAEIASALSYLHKLGIMYRDLKPGNILLFEDGHIKLTDFGSCVDAVGETLSGHDCDTMLPLYQKEGLDNLNVAQEEHCDMLPVSYKSWVNGESAATNLTDTENGSSNSCTSLLTPVDVNVKNILKAKSIKNSVRSSTQRSSMTLDMVPFNKRPRTSTVLGTMGYIAPEVLNVSSRVGISSFYTYSCDWFGFGVTLYRMYSGTKPYIPCKSEKDVADANDADDVDVDVDDAAGSAVDDVQLDDEFDRSGGKKEVYKGTLSFNDTLFSPKAKNFITSLLDFNPKTRLGSGFLQSDEVLQHEYFSHLDMNAVALKLVKPPPLTKGMIDVANNRFYKGVNKGNGGYLPATKSLMDQLGEHGLSMWSQEDTVTTETIEMFRSWNCCASAAIAHELQVTRTNSGFLVGSLTLQ